MATEDAMVRVLTKICDEKSAGYLESRPMSVYRTLVQDEGVDARLAGALLLTLLAGIPTLASEEHDVGALEGAIERACPLTQEACESLARVYCDLFDAHNMRRWDDLAWSGLEELKGASLELTWEGEEVWRPGSADLVCHYTADIGLVGRYPQDDAVDAALEENPLLSAKDVLEMFAVSLRAFLDDNFEYFITADDYYPPLTSEFEAEDYTRDWCSRHGFELSSFEGSGTDEGFEPPSRRRW